MTNITLEQIDTIMDRANISYSEAKAALEQTNGDIIATLLKLEEYKKIKPIVDPVKEKKSYSKRFNTFIKDLNKSSFTLQKGTHTYINIPLAFAITIFFFSLPFSFIALILSLALGIKMNIEGQEDISEKINSTFSN
ncbi:UBA domain-containing protein [Cellulosilyticum ruminicola]|uniref:hypothetical protein n=1 Tax=Cellulosilyticum ruminicola TaxID=425254 RepID=UPI0006D2826B|nr:hypothetical protein [Cellulosilyticum ruminicola]